MSRKRLTDEEKAARAEARREAQRLKMAALVWYTRELCVDAPYVRPPKATLLEAMRPRVTRP